MAKLDSVKLAESLVKEAFVVMVDDVPWAICLSEDAVDTLIDRLGQHHPDSLFRFDRLPVIKE